MNELDIMKGNLTILASDIKHLIEQSRNRVAAQVNSAATILYWNIGKRIREEVLKGQRAEYGKRVLSELGKELTATFGRGWGEQQLRHCVRCAEVFSDERILYTLCTELSWSHIRQLMFIDDKLKRNFYIEMCRMEHWSVRQLGDRIDSMLYERTAISKKPDETIAHDIELLRSEKQLTTDMALRDPLILDFLGLKDTYSEKDLESAILANLQSFIMELGSDFAFLARQKRITIDSLIELLELGKSGIHVAQYLTELPDKKVLEAQLIKSIRMAKEQFI